MEIIRRAADPIYSRNLQHSIELIDALLDISITRKPLKALFGLAGLEHDEDFVSLLEVSIGIAFKLFCTGSQEIGGSQQARGRVPLVHGKRKSGILKLEVPSSRSSAKLLTNLSMEAMPRSLLTTLFLTWSQSRVYVSISLYSTTRSISRRQVARPSCTIGI